MHFVTPIRTWRLGSYHPLIFPFFWNSCCMYFRVFWVVLHAFTHSVMFYFSFQNTYFGVVFRSSSLILFSVPTIINFTICNLLFIFRDVCFLTGWSYILSLCFTFNFMASVIILNWMFQRGFSGDFRLCSLKVILSLYFRSKLFELQRE